jgi:endonuclease/exonuclease/phosphatase family metal-dependent hydrolase
MVEGFLLVLPQSKHHFMLSLFNKPILTCAFALLFSVQWTNAQTFKGVHSFAFYNVENLFDTEDDPAIDDAEYLPTSDLKWDERRLSAKINNLARVIDSLGDEDGPEIIGFAEIENRPVVELLLSHQRLAGKKYKLAHFDSPDARGIDVGLAYKSGSYTLQHAVVLPVKLADEPNFATRDILLAEFSHKKTRFYVLANHWPSRRGGEEASRPKRMAAAEVARGAVDSLLNLNPNAKILLMGDFNDEPFDAPVQYLVNGKPGSVKLTNAMEPLKKQDIGSLYYQKKANLIDQIIYSPAMADAKGNFVVVEGSARVFNAPWLQETDARFAGQPFRTFAGKKYLGGYSDHFPVYIHIKP